MSPEEQVYPDNYRINAGEYGEPFDISNLKIQGHLIIEPGAVFLQGFKGPKEVSGNFIWNGAKINGVLDLEGVIVGRNFYGKGLTIEKGGKRTAGFSGKGMIVGGNFELSEARILDGFFDGREMVIAGDFNAPAIVRGPFYGVGLIFGMTNLENTVIMTLASQRLIAILCTNQCSPLSGKLIDAGLRAQIVVVDHIFSRLREGRTTGELKRFEGGVFQEAKKCADNLFAKASQSGTAEIIKGKIEENEGNKRILAQLRAYRE